MSRTIAAICARKRRIERELKPKMVGKRELIEGFT